MNTKVGEISKSRGAAATQPYLDAIITMAPLANVTTSRAIFPKPATWSAATKASPATE